MTLWKAFCRAVGITCLFGNHRFVSTAYGGWQMDDSRPVDIVTGCFLLIERKLWNQLRGFDLTFFMFGEEADLCVRAARVFDARPHFTPQSQIVHYGGASESIRAERLVRLLTAQITYVDRHFPGWQKQLGKFLIRMIPASRLLTTSLAAMVTRRERFRTASESWREVWSRRMEWRGGYVEQ
jgi:GT2 family glycosyltransferase